MTFKVTASLNMVRLANGEWKLQFNVPLSDSIEMAKISCTCQEEPLKLTIDIEESKTLGEKA